MNSSPDNNNKKTLDESKVQILRKESHSQSCAQVNENIVSIFRDNREIKKQDSTHLPNLVRPYPPHTGCNMFSCCSKQTLKQLTAGQDRSIFFSATCSTVFVSSRLILNANDDANSIFTVFICFASYYQRVHSTSLTASWYRSVPLCVQQQLLNRVRMNERAQCKVSLASK